MDKDVSPAPVDARDERLTTVYAQIFLRLGALFLLLYWAFQFVSPFVSIVIWSGVLSVAIYPLFDWVAAKLGGRRRLAAFLVSLLLLLVAIGPVTWLAVGLVETLRTISAKLEASTLLLPAPPGFVKKLPLIGEQAYQFWLLASTNIKDAVAKIAPQFKPLVGNLLDIAATAGTSMLVFFVSIIVAGFLLPHGTEIAALLKKSSRKLIASRGDELVNLAGATIRTVSRGVIGISVLQSLLAGVGMVLAGVPAASLLTIGVLILGIVQIGPGIILIPLIIWSWFTFETGSALLFTAYMIPVGLLDNVLRPFVMARGLRTPMVVVLIGVIGGIISYGLSGLFLGPIVLSVIWELFSAWTETAKEDPNFSRT